MAAIGRVEIVDLGERRAGYLGGDELGDPLAALHLERPERGRTCTS